MSSKVEEFGLPSPHSRYELPASGYESQENEMQPLPNGVSVVRRSPMLYRPAQLAEDETILACSHHAHEIARAHGAREVMLEHLVHAFARVASASAILEDRGINVEALRRDSAAVISSEIPVDQAVGYGQLRASRDFNTVMFLAAAGASHRDEKATGVRDVLEALLKYDPKSRAVRLIKRHAFGADLEERPDPMQEMRNAFERLASDLRAGQERVAAELRLALTDMKSAQTNLASDVASDRHTVGDRLKHLADAAASGRADLGTLQRLVSDRLQAIERVAGQAGGASQIQTLFGDRFLQIHKGLDGQRTDLQRMEAGVAERLKGVERAIEMRLGDAARTWSTLGERLTAIEDAVTSVQPSDGGGVSHAVESRLEALQKAVEGQRLDWQRIESGNSERLRAFERTIDAQVTGLQRHWSGFGERFGLVEKAIAEPRGLDMSRIETLISKSLDTELDQVRNALVALGHAQQTLSTAIDEWRLNNSGDLSIISNRLQVLERVTNGALNANSATLAGNGVVGNAGTSMPSTPALAGSQSAILDKVDRALKNRYNATQSGA